MNTKIKAEKRIRRKKRIRAKIFGTNKKPRFSVFKSNRYIYAQLIDDERGLTLASASSKTVKGKNFIERAKTTGIMLGEAAKTKNIKMAVFDRSGYIYTGAVAALADGARETGLKF